MYRRRMPPIVARIRNLLIDPRSEWPLIASESGDPLRPLVGYVALLAAIPALAGFVGATFVGTSVSVGKFHDPIYLGLIKAVVSYLLSFVIVYLVALAIHLMAPLFGGQRRFPNALKLSVYSFTPVWLVGIVLLIPGLRFLSILGLYALRLIWTGVPPLMGAPRPKVLPYAIAIAVAAFVIVFVMAFLQAVITILPFQTED
jgi:hypothetical protein